MAKKKNKQNKELNIENVNTEFAEETNNDNDSNNNNRKRKKNK